MEYVFLFPGRDLFTSFKKFYHQTKSSCIESNKALLKMFHTVKLQFLTERQLDVGNVNCLWSSYLYDIYLRIFIRNIFFCNKVDV